MKEMNASEWNILGEKLFGNKRVNWRFRCPKCNSIQTARDFLLYRERGVSPGTVLVACKGNFPPLPGSPLIQAPCDFNTVDHSHEELILVLNEAGKQIPTFPFAD